MTAKRAQRIWILLLSTLGVAAAARAGEPAPRPEPSREALVEQVRQAEIAFAATVPARDRMRFGAMIEEDAVFVGARGATRGRAAILAAWEGFFAVDAPEFHWRPELVELSADGTLGLTRGPWTLRVRRPDGTDVLETGIFNSVWRRQADGSWRVLFDAGCPSCPVCPPPVPPPPGESE